MVWHLSGRFCSVVQLGEQLPSLTLQQSKRGWTIGHNEGWVNGTCAPGTKVAGAPLLPSTPFSSPLLSQPLPFFPLPIPLARSLLHFLFVPCHTFLCVCVCLSVSLCLMLASLRHGTGTRAQVCAERHTHTKTQHGLQRGSQKTQKNTKGNANGGRKGEKGWKKGMWEGCGGKGRGEAEIPACPLQGGTLFFLTPEWGCSFLPCPECFIYLLLSSSSRLSSSKRRAPRRLI